MKLEDWLDLEFLKSLSQHASSAIAVIACFKAVGKVVSWGVHEQWVKTSIDYVDDFVVIGLAIWLVVVLAIQLWKRINRNSDLNIVLA